MSEVRLWQQCKVVLDKASVYAERLTDKLKTGIPDSFFVQNGVTHWMELKVIEWVTDAIDIRADQIATLYRLHRNGAPTWLLVRDTKGKRLFLFGGINTGGRLKPTIPFAQWNKLKDSAFLFTANEAGNPHLKVFASTAQAVSHVLLQRDQHEF